MTPIQALDFFGKICDERINLARQSGQGLTADVLLAHAQEAAKVLGPVAQKASEPVSGASQCVNPYLRPNPIEPSP